MKNHKFSVVYQTIALITLSSATYVNALPCSIANGQINATNSCETNENNLTNINVNAGATVNHDTASSLIINNPGIESNSNGINVTGSNANYLLNASDTTKDITIDIGDNKNQRGRGISVEKGATATVKANNVTIKSKDKYTNDWNANNALWAGSGGQLTIFADKLDLSVENATTPYGTIGVNNGSIKIQGNNGLSIATISNTGGSSAGIWAEGKGTIDLDLVKINTDSSQDYVMGVYTKNKGSTVTFAGGEIGSLASRAGSAIRTLEQSQVIAKGYDKGSLIIQTNGTDSRGIRATGGSSVILNNDKHSNFVTQIHTTGSISDGINAGRLGTMHKDGKIFKHGGEIGSELASSSIETYGETHIKTDSENSYGLRLIGDGASIKMHALDGQGRSTIHSATTAIRFNFGNGYSLNEDGSSAKDLAQNMMLENVDITSDGKSGKFELINTSDNNSFICKLGGCDKNGNNTYASGNLIQVGDHSLDVGMLSHINDNNLAMTVADSVKNGVLLLKNSSATAAENTDLLNVTYGGGTAKVTDKVSSSFNLTSNASILKGSIFTDKTLDKDNQTSQSNISLNNQSTWYIQRDSNVTNLNVQDSEIYLNRYDNWKDEQGKLLENANQPSNYTVLETNKLTGNNSRFYFQTDIVNQKTDKLIITDKDGTNGQHYVIVKNDGSQSTTGTEKIDIIETNGNHADFKLINKVELGGYEYDLRQITDPDSDDLGGWELYSTGSKQKPSKPSKTSTAQATLSFANTNYLLVYIDIQTLLQRIGDLRNISDHQGDFWIRGVVGQLNSFASVNYNDYKMNYRGLQSGIDKLVYESENGRFYLGGMIGYYDVDQDFKQGSGSGKNYNVGLYSTYINNNDFYLDGIFKLSKLKNQFDVRDSQGKNISGKGNTHALSLSLEAGKRFYLSDEKQGLYAEPQLQVVYTRNGADSTKASNALKVKYDRYNSLIGRTSVIMGYAIPNIKNQTNIYLKTGYVKEFDGDTSYRLNHIKESNQYRGHWFENALGINATIQNNHHIYSEVDFAKGNKFNKKQINLGYRYNF
ncbi:autotransporter outer membrane beta-barrel domain-containing protein [Gilliamella sp. CG13]|uniref:autotransporter outer membrane beta-barrel domain-containing protein n=1 Tax=Gilliamella sp. CG13 TaxID=3351502 RepID=UPI0039873852